MQFLLHIVWCRQTATWSKGCQLSCLQAPLPLTKKLEGSCGVDAWGRGRRARDRLRRSVFAHLVAWILHTQDHGLRQGYSTVSGQVRGVDKVRQGCDIQRLRSAVVGDHHGLENALGALFEVKIRPVDGSCPVRVLDALRRGEHAGRAGRSYFSLTKDKPAGSSILKLMSCAASLLRTLTVILAFCRPARIPRLALGCTLAPRIRLGQSSATAVGAQAPPRTASRGRTRGRYIAFG